MSPHPSSSSSTRISAGNDSKLPSEPIIDMNYLMRRLCTILEVSTDEEEITSGSFVKSVLDYVGEVVERGKESRRLISVLNDHAQLVAHGTARVAQLRRANHPNDRNANAESSSQMRQSGNGVLFVDLTQTDDNTIPVLSPAMSIASVPVSPRIPEVISLVSTPQHSVSPSASQACVISAVSLVKTPDQRETDIKPSGDDNNHAMITAPTLPPTLSKESPQTALSSSSSQSSSLRQSLPRKSKEKQSNNCSKKKTCSKPDRKNKTKSPKQGTSKKQKHECRNYKDGHYKYHCTCGSKFSSEGAQKNHIKRNNSEWKFTCDHCMDKFFDLSKLKTHLEKQHNIAEPLKEYIIGCTRCGFMYRTRSAFYSHRKTAHNIEQGPRWPRKSPQRPWKTPGQRDMLATPQDVEIDVGVNGEVEGTRRPAYMPGLVRDYKEERNGGSLPSSIQEASTSQAIKLEHPNGPQRGRGNPEHNRHNFYRYSCGICNQAFVSFFGAYTNIRKHMRRKHKSSRRVVKCAECGVEFGTCKSFDQHWVSSHQLN